MSDKTDRLFCFTVSESDDKERIDCFLAGQLGQEMTISRSYIKNLIKNGAAERILSEDDPDSAQAVTKPSYPVEEGEVIRITLPESAVPDILPEDIPLDIVYEDDQLMVINKPRGMVVHPAAGHYSNTVVNAVMYHCLDPETGKYSLSGINGVLRPGIVHRIDRDTTGSLIICKTDLAHQSIAAQLKEHSSLREYTAIVYGCIDEDSLTIDRPIGRDPKDRMKNACRSDGKRAVTHVEVLERFQKFTYIRCRLETGRTHQIRVHMAYAGHPVICDPLYAAGRVWTLPASLKVNGQCLHAKKLEFVHPVTGETISTTVPEPDDFMAVLDYLRQMI